MGKLRVHSGHQVAALDGDLLEAKGARLHHAAADALPAHEADLVLLGELLVAVDALDGEAHAVRHDVAAEVAEGDGEWRWRRRRA